MKKKRYPDEYKQKVVEEFRAGATAKSLAAKHKIATSMVHYWAKKFGTPGGTRQPRVADPYSYKDALVYLKHAKAHINASLKEGRLKEMDQAHLLTLLALQTLEGKT